jgi:uncharacterized damage-inducible protein DinB
MTDTDLDRQIIGTWTRHNDILLFLLRSIPAKGFAALPAGSRGRDVARQFNHLNRVRLGWLHYHRTGKRPKLPRGDSGPRPSRVELRRALTASGRDVSAFLEDCLSGDARPRMFGREVVRWLGYLISHESHHRGQIMLALKQSGFRLPEKIAVQGLWGKWISGK